ncbi:MAG TPA: peptidylprolyl isomerase [Bryobacteraceae bacterium]|nr:peptidylprolyl isomerase [Bryobacteraceae bacterium]
MPLTINGEVITDQEIRAATATMRQELEARNGPLELEQRMQLRERAMHGLVERTLIYQEARRLELSPTDAEVAELAATLVPRGDGDGTAGCRAGIDTLEVAQEAKRRLTIERLIEYWGKGVKRPTPGEIRDYYRRNKQRFERPEMIHAAHIVKNAETAQQSPDELRVTMEGLRQQLLDEADFAALAAVHSDCPDNGGDLGFFARGTMVDEFDEQVFNAPMKTPTPVFETPFGLHIAIVYERRAAGVAKLEEVAPTIEGALFRALHDREVGVKLGELQTKAVVKLGAA